MAAPAEGFVGDGEEVVGEGEGLGAEVGEGAQDEREGVSVVGAGADGLAVPEEVEVDREGGLTGAPLLLSDPLLASFVGRCGLVCCRLLSVPSFLQSTRPTRLLRHHDAIVGQVPSYRRRELHLLSSRPKDQAEPEPLDIVISTEGPGTAWSEVERSGGRRPGGGREPAAEPRVGGHSPGNGARSSNHGKQARASASPRPGAPSDSHR